MSKFILITGMHRSGTSALTGFLRDNGVFVGNVDKTNAHNPKGNVEQKLVNKINEKVMNASGGSWMNPIAPVRWNPFLIDVKEAIISFLQTKDLFGIKDPRFVFTCQEWLKNITDYQIVASFRSPLSVAKSLQKRNGFPLEFGLELWKKYNLQLLQLSISEKIRFVHYTGNPDLDCLQFNKIHKALMLESPINLDFYDADISKYSKFNDIAIDYDKDLTIIFEALLKRAL